MMTIMNHYFEIIVSIPLCPFLSLSTLSTPAALYTTSLLPISIGPPIVSSSPFPNPRGIGSFCPPPIWAGASGPLKL